MSGINHRFKEITMAVPNYKDNSFAGFLEERPQVAYYSSPTGMAFGGRSPASQKFFERSFGDIYNQYLGELGSQIRDYSSVDSETGKRKREDAPSLTFTEYLKQDPFTSRYTAMPPAARGSFTGAYAPQTRRIFY